MSVEAGRSRLRHGNGVSPPATPGRTAAMPQTLHRPAASGAGQVSEPSPGRSWARSPASRCRRRPRPRRARPTRRAARVPWRAYRPISRSGARRRRARRRVRNAPPCCRSGPQADDLVEMIAIGLDRRQLGTEDARLLEPALAGAGPLPPHASSGSSRREPRPSSCARCASPSRSR